MRDCGTRGEPSAIPHATDLVIGPSRWHSLAGFADAPASQFASRADDPGFQGFINSERGRADSRRERWLRLAPTHYGQQMVPVSVRAGHTVTLSIAPGDRRHASFVFRNVRGRQVGPYASFRVSDGTPSVRFKACRASQPRFSGPGPVGPWTTYPGAMIVGGARCVTFELRERGRPVRRKRVAFGARC